MSQHAYAYAVPPAPAAPRQYSGHGTSSAFSSSANPDEDWTKISDLAERRRIQNRIAQRNYRKKLKRRLEDLEQMAGTKQSNKRQATPKAKAQQKAQPQQQHQQQRPPHTVSVVAPPKQMPSNQFTPPMHAEDYLTPPTTYERERSHTPPLFGYSTYPPPPEDMLLAGYSAAQPYRTMTAEVYPGDYLATTVPVTLPSMTHFSDAIKREQGGFGAEDSLSPYISYGSYLPGLEMSAGAHSPYDNSNPLTPPLSHSFDHSASCSDSGSYEYPTTPLSIPGSPGMCPQQL